MHVAVSRPCLPSCGKSGVLNGTPGRQDVNPAVRHFHCCPLAVARLTLLSRAVAVRGIVYFPTRLAHLHAATLDKVVRPAPHDSSILRIRFLWNFVGTGQYADEALLCVSFHAAARCAEFDGGPARMQPAPGCRA